MAADVDVPVMDTAASPTNMNRKRRSTARWAEMDTGRDRVLLVIKCEELLLSNEYGGFTEQVVETSHRAFPTAG